MINPFYEAQNHTYLQVCKKIQNYFGVDDADKFYVHFRKRIIDNCTEDVHHVQSFNCLLEYCENARLRARYYVKETV